MTGSSAVVCEIDFERDGKQVGTANLPHSPHEDAWGVMPIPIAVVKNGVGPTVVLMGGNHGDEYEGPIILGGMIRDLDPGEISGRLILVPAINTPAVLAGRRTSPVDGLNFNRCFPGDRSGTMTRQIAQFVHDVLFVKADAFVDLHAGGSSLDIMPSAIVEPAADRALMDKNMAAALAFGAPYTVVLDNLGDPRTSTASAVQAGLVTVGAELGRGGAVSRDALDVGTRGVRNVLAHLGVMDASVVPPTASPLAGARERRVVRVPGTAGYVYAPAAGVFEPFHDKDDLVEAGAPAGLVHFLAEPTREPVAAPFKCSGRVFARRQPGRVEAGNCVAVVVEDFDAGSAG